MKDELELAKDTTSPEFKEYVDSKDKEWFENIIKYHLTYIPTQLALNEYENINKMAIQIQVAVQALHIKNRKQEG